MKPLSLIAIISIIAIAGCISGNVVNNMGAQEGDHVSVHYTGTLEDGTVFDSSEGREPLEFDVGAGQMIKGFDEAVVGMEEWDEKTITLSPEEAYGERNDKNMLEVPLQSVPENVKVGDTLSAGGMPVKVIEVGSSTVKLDANHPLAGKTLIFKVKMVKIDKK